MGSGRASNLFFPSLVTTSKGYTVSSSEFTLPDVGEGLTEAEIVSWRVKPGDTVSINQVLVEIETAKSLVELPSPFTGTVTEILVAEGTTVDVGTPIITVSSGVDTAAQSSPVVQSSSASETQLDVATAEPSEPAESSGAVLVGYGIAGKTASRRSRVVPSGASPITEASIAATNPVMGETADDLSSSSRRGSVLAKPPIRKIAKDLSVLLSDVLPTGRSGEVTREDVIRHASATSNQAALAAQPDHASAATRYVAPLEREERIAVKGIRKVIAQAMVGSAFSAPHVSLFVDVDATRTMEFVKRLKASTDYVGVKVSPLLIVAKAMIWAAKRNPMVNAQWAGTEIIVKHYVNFGIAAATPRGLIVPNIKEADSMGLRELATAIEVLTIAAREGKTQPAEQLGGTITVTNIGVFGMDTGTPILNSGEVAILALGTIKLKPWVVDGEVCARFVTTLGGSFDHRVVDGDVASRFLGDVASILEEPALLLE